MRTVAEHVRGGAMGKDKGMLKGERGINRQSLVEKECCQDCRRGWSARKRMQEKHARFAAAS